MSRKNDSQNLSRTFNLATPIKEKIVNIKNNLKQVNKLLEEGYRVGSMLTNELIVLVKYN